MNPNSYSVLDEEYEESVETLIERMERWSKEDQGTEYSTCNICAEILKLLIEYS